MDKEQAVRFLRLPAAGIVDYALGQANLTQRERLAVDLCGRQGYTQEAAAIEADVSVEAVHKWWGTGIAKCCTAWDGNWWILKLIAER